VRFNWTGTWGYAWYIDRVCVTQQPANDIQLSYGVVSHNGTSEEYGRVPTAQVDGEITYSAAVFNFGSADQTGVDVYMDVLDGEGGLELSTAFGADNTYGLDAEGYVDFSYPAQGPLASNDIFYFDMGVDASSMGPDKYTAMFVSVSDEDGMQGEFSADNDAMREFEVTVNEYSSDGLGMHSLADVSRMGTGSFTDASDGFTMFAYYDISAATEVVGARIMLDSYDWGNAFTTPATVAEGELVVTLRDTTLMSSEAYDPLDFIAESDFYMVTEDDVINGFIDVNFDQPVSVQPNAYYIGVEMYSNGNETDIYILDDETVPQPSYLSMIYIPEDQVYSNGNAVGIRMITSDEDVVSVKEQISEFNIYPNPSNGILNIELDKSGNYSIQVSDLIGKVVSTRNITSNVALDLQHLERGVYFVNISSNDISTTHKIVIER